MRVQRRRRKQHSVIEASSLSDILFFLLLFFLMISTLASPNAIKILLPNANSGNVIPSKKVNIYIDAAGALYVESKPTTIDVLPSQLDELNRGVPKLSIVLRADKAVTVQSLVEIVDVANKLKIPLVVATAHAKQ